MNSPPLGGSTASNALLATRGLGLTRGDRALFTDLSVSLRSGELLQIEGANGSGKTSLLRILAGLSRYGYIGAVERHAPLLYLGHKTAVKALLTPRENLFLHVSGEGNFAVSDIDSALAMVGLAGYEDLPAHTLSAGQQRRINLARLYVSAAPVWLLDEPFTAIDRAGVTALEARMATHLQHGGAIAVTSHQALTIQGNTRHLSLDQGGAR